MTLAARVAAAKTSKAVGAALLAEFGPIPKRVNQQGWVCPKCSARCLKARVKQCLRCRDEERVLEVIVTMREAPTLQAVAWHLSCQVTARLARAFRAVVGRSLVQTTTA